MFTGNKSYVLAGGYEIGYWDMAMGVGLGVISLTDAHTAAMEVGMFQCPQCELGWMQSKFEGMGLGCVMCGYDGGYVKKG